MNDPIQFLKNDEYLALFKHDPRGIRVFEELMFFHYDISSFNKDNTHVTAFNEGRRSVVKWIIEKMAIAENESRLGTTEQNNNNNDGE